MQNASILISDTTMDPKMEKRLDTLYRNTKQMPLLTLLGLLVPIVIAIAVPLGIVYSAWRKTLLRAIDSGEISIESADATGSPSNAEKVDFIRARKLTLLAPTFVAVFYLLLVAILVTFIAINSPEG